ncbi:MAG TPA: type IV secretory system conjugative DNA transfer family protein [Coxiellaceae bacterium]|nr:type IV secretory system conjugative DNA transfer family protein [Coxiellaceae bacterium]
MKIKVLLVCLSLSLSLLGCASKTPQAMIGYVNVNQMPEGTNTVTPIKRQALREAAMTLGAQGALAWQAEHINNALQSESVYLDHIFNFDLLLINNNVLPPVLVQSDQTLNLAGDDAIRLANKTYELVAPARFVTTPPTWRTYLWLNFKKPSLPDHSMLPKDQAESIVWNQYLQEGWQQGLQQADAIFAANLARLKRDYVGMVLYRKLLAQHMVSAPYIAKADLGITGDSHQIRIDDQIIRITSNSELQPDADKWKPVITNSNDPITESKAND